MSIASNTASKPEELVSPDVIFWDADLPTKKQQILGHGIEVSRTRTSVCGSSGRTDAVVANVTS